MRLAVFFSALILVGAPAALPTRISARAHIRQANPPASALVIIADPGSDAVRGAASMAALGIVTEFEALGTDASRSALAAAETARQVFRVPNGTPGRIRTEGTTSGSPWLRVEILDQAHRGRILYMAATKAIRE